MYGSIFAEGFVSMRQQTHESIPKWITRYDQLTEPGWVRVSGTFTVSCILLVGGRLSMDQMYTHPTGEKVVAYGFWNGTELETMFVAPLSLSSELMVGYEKTHYCAGPFSIQWGRVHRELDQELESEKVQSWMFITAENPHSQPTPTHNSQYNQLLHEEIIRMGLRYWKGWGVPHCSTWSPEASFLVLGVSEDMATFYKRSFHQNAVVYGEIRKKAVFL